MYKVLTLSLLLVLGTTAQAQLFFNKTLHDFGDVWQGETVSHIFEAQNVGQKSLSIKQANSACACLKPSFNNAQVAPGKTAPIELAFNSDEKLGPFEKAAIIEYEGATQPVILTVRGNVKPAKKPLPPIKLESKLPDTLGFLAVSEKNINIGYIRSDQEKEVQVTIKNLRNYTVNFTNVSSTKPTVEAKLAKMTLGAGEETILTIKFIGSKGDAAGYGINQTINESVYLKSDDPSNLNLGFMFTAIYERFYTEEEKANAPVIEFKEKEFDGGDILQGQVLTHQFYFTNTGKSDLYINSVKASCGCTAVEPSEKVVKPGQMSKIEARFDSNGKSGPQSKTITVGSSDPNNPYIVLTLKCNINVNPFHMGGN